MNSKNETNDRTVLITGAGKRLGKSMALALAENGWNILIHYGSDAKAAEDTGHEVEKIGRKAWVFQADFNKPIHTEEVFKEQIKIYNPQALINNASIFENYKMMETDLDIWVRHQNINLTSPFIISKIFSENLAGKPGTILNMLDWRALRPGREHFAYTISKAGLAAMTSAMALALAPQIQVNGIALGAILPPENPDNLEQLIKRLPIPRWAEMEELHQTVLFFLNGPGYITGEIIHLDGGRHLI
ncbi:MAG: hypothetical protein CVU39_05510 [Chloroflexi bacterium HGW-Chloroflexi-10]|nr:MAG: hypothetical protein CVU39_05510 [Chloroflexi bacterium HGW-Chloroflexi-10]